MAAIGLVDLVGAPTGAQSADVAAVVASVDSNDVPISGSNTSPSVSDDGQTVVFSNGMPAVVDGAADVHSLVVRSRAVASDPGSTLVIPVGAAPTTASISGDGCAVAYSVLVDRPIAELPDEATPDGENPDGENPDGEDPDGEAPELSSTMVELRLVDLCHTDAVEPPTSVLDRIEGDAPLPAPAMSVDGGTTAWPHGSEVVVYADTSTPDAPVNVAVATGSADHVVGAQLDVTADGLTILFESGAPTVEDPDVVATSVFVATLPTPVGSDPAPVPVVDLLAPSDAGSAWPTISADGTIAVYQTDAPTLLPAAPADAPYLVLVDRTTAPATQRILTTDATRPDLAADGSAVAYTVFDSVRVRRSDSTTPFAEATEQVANPALSSEFGESVGASVNGPVMSGDGGDVVFDHLAGVDLSADAAVAVDAHVWIMATAPLFAPPPPPTTIDNATTTTVPSIGAPASVVTTPRTTPRATTPRNTTRTTPRPTTRPTAPATTAVQLPVSFEPAAFEFAPTIINAGRRTATVDIVNPTSSPVTVTGVSVDAVGAAHFGADGAGCAEPLQPGSRCTVDLGFGPTAAGELTANVVATMTDGSTATLALRGVGAPEPALSVLPGVASAGQVVTVFGSGFPAGSTVDYSWNDGRLTGSVLVDDLGGFGEPLVVLPNTSGGPITVSVAGQTDLFGDVSATMLVTGSSSRGNVAVITGGVIGGYSV